MYSLHPHSSGTLTVGVRLGFLLVTYSCRVAVAERAETSCFSVQLHRSTGKKMEAQIRGVTCCKVTCAPNGPWFPTPASCLHQLGDLQLSSVLTWTWSQRHTPWVKGSVPQDTIQTPIPSHLYF